MARVTPTKAERDANLDALKKAVNEYADNEIRRLDNETKFMRSVLQGRGIEETTTANLAEASALTVREINEYLVTG